MPHPLLGRRNWPERDGERRPVPDGSVRAFSHRGGVRGCALEAAWEAFVLWSNLWWHAFVPLPHDERSPPVDSLPPIYNGMLLSRLLDAATHACAGPLEAVQHEAWRQRMRGQRRSARHCFMKQASGREGHGGRGSWSAGIL